MKTLLRIPACLLLIAIVWLSALWAAAAEELPTAIQDYAARPDPAFSWRIQNKQSRAQDQVWEVELVSQNWHGMVWKHSLLIFHPRELRHPEHVLLFITGGSTGQKLREDNVRLGLRLATLAKARVAMLHHVPNQPLLDGRKEDDLITETWLRYLDSGDVTWILQLPMAKSAVRAMDAVEAIAKAEWKGSVRGFVVTGASKRGWTTWLSAVADPRVKAIAPMVIDMLNLRPQMRYQLDTWGAYSEQIEDYTRKGLIKEGELTDREALLLRLVDPYTYRSQLTLPKLLIHGTNDPYWPVDAAKLYWNDLVGPKSLLEVANGNHGLKGGQDLAVATLAAFFRHVAGQSPWPTLQWKHGDAEGGFVLEIQSSPKPKAARLWVAHSLTKDVRQSEWASQPLADHGGGFLAKVPKPEQGHVAFFGELQFETDGLPFSLCTLVRRE